MVDTDVGMQLTANKANKVVKNSQGLKKTSVSVEPDLWKRFGSELRLKDVDISTALNGLIRGYLENSDAVLIGADGTITFTEIKGSTGHRPKAQNSRFAIHPQNEEEEIFTGAVILMLRDKPSVRTTPRAVLQSLLDHWIEKVKTARASKSA